MNRLGRFVIRGTLGRGAMGVVYDGWDPQIDRRVAIKTVPLSIADDDDEAIEALARFKREAQAAGRLSHENIVGVFDYGETDALAYIVMEFVEGRSLKSLIDQEQRLQPAEAAEIMLQVLRGLEYSHRRGVVHRDIKPANVMLTTDGQVKLADFGIARISSSSMTSVGVIMGTPAYMPPEQFMGEVADERSDIYAAGATLFHMLTGHRPYEGNPTSIMQKVLNAEGPPDPSLRWVALSPAWDRVVHSAMARRPADRFDSAARFADAIRAALIQPAPPLVGDGDAGTEADATMLIAPVRGPVPPLADLSSFIPLPVSPSAPGSAPAPAAIGRPITLYASLGALFLVLAGAGAWFAFRPSAPEIATPLETKSRPISPAPIPTPTPAPVRPIPAPTPEAPVMPSLEAVSAALSVTANNTPCSLTTVISRGDTLRLGGIGSAAANATLRQAAAASGRPVNTALQTFIDRYCDTLDLLRPIIRATSGPLNLSITTDASSFAYGGEIPLRVADLPFEGWLDLDYIDSDGTVTHLYPSSGGPIPYDPPVLAHKGATFRTAPPHARLMAGSPKGTDMVVAIETSTRLYQRLRPQGESVTVYSASLKSALAALQAKGARVAASVLLVTTLPN